MTLLCLTLETCNTLIRSFDNVQFFHFNQFQAVAQVLWFWFRHLFGLACIQQGKRELVTVKYEVQHDTEAYLILKINIEDV
jgi:hypothetical protein